MALSRNKFFVFENRKKSNRSAHDWGRTCSCAVNSYAANSRLLPKCSSMIPPSSSPAAPLSRSATPAAAAERWQASDIFLTDALP